MNPFWTSREKIAKNRNMGTCKRLFFSWVLEIIFWWLKQILMPSYSQDNARSGEGKEK